MAILRAKEIRALDQQEREAKLMELKFSLIKANVSSQKGKSKIKELKRTIARFHTINNESKLGKTGKEVSSNK